MVRHTHQWKIYQKQPSQFLVFGELCANWSLCICEVFMITSELTASHECQIYGQTVKYLNQICLPELIHLKKNACCSQMPWVMSCHFASAKEIMLLSKRNLLTICRMWNTQSIWIIDSLLQLVFHILNYWLIYPHGAWKNKINSKLRFWV